MADNTSTTKSLGIHQSDIVIRTALLAGIRDLRANPWLLDYCFASLAQDTLTNTLYGKNEIGKAKDWFLKHNIDVSLDVQLQKASFPVVTITLLSSVEDDTTLADIDPEVEEDLDHEVLTIAGPFTPTKYDTTTGYITLPEGTGDGVILAAGMVLADRFGNEYPITDVPDDLTIVIAPNTIADLGGATIRAATPAQRIALEGSWFQESYRLGVHVQGEPIYVVYLDSIVRFVLLRYRQRLLESRGFESSTVNAADLVKNEGLEVENTYSRYLTINGRVRNYWPKDVMQKFVGFSTQFQVSGAGKVPVTDIPEGETTAVLNWIGDEDSLG